MTTEEFCAEWFDEMRARAKTERDPSLLVFMVRDSELVEQAGLKDLAWAICRYYCVANDIIGFFDLLQEYVNLLQEYANEEV